MISDVLKISKSFVPQGFLVTLDIENAFDSVYRCFLLIIPQKFGFGIDSVSWIKTILNNPESCIINGKKTTNSFKSERCAREGDQISAYLFILNLETFFVKKFVENNPKVKSLNIFKDEF